MLNRKLREKWVFILDSNDAWEHVLFNYLIEISRNLSRTSTGKLDFRNNLTRIAYAIAQTNDFWADHVPLYDRAAA